MAVRAFTAVLFLVLGSVTNTVGLAGTATGQKTPTTAAKPGLASATPAKVSSCPQPPPGVKYDPDVTYFETDNGPLQLDIAYPSAEKGLCPVVVILHGTGITKGRKANVPLAFQLAQNGYVGVAVTFRHTAEHPYPTAIEDAWAALRWVRKNAGQYQIDPKRIAALGYSGGGTLACLLGMTEDTLRAKDAPSSTVQAVVAYYPVTDLARLHDDCCKNTLGVAGTLFIRPNLEKWLGGTPAQAKERYAAASPVTHVHEKMAPTLLVHGTDDKVVPLEQSQLLADRAALKGGKVTLLRLPGAAHLLDESNDDNAALAAQMVQAFLDRYLRANQSSIAKR
jgi:acetyl esterase/lipase